LFKGGLVLTAGLFVLAQVAYRAFVPALPVFETMGVVSLLALLGNGSCLALLWKHRKEDINMNSVWECSRNDITSNLAVFAAAGGVWLSGSRWPDLLVGAVLAVLFLRSAVRVAKCDDRTQAPSRRGGQSSVRQARTSLRDSSSLKDHDVENKDHDETEPSTQDSAKRRDPSVPSRCRSRGIEQSYLLVESG
jgi:Co/Zn/Cd efflux system component